MIKFEISKELAEAVLNYLANRPYREVFILMQQLQSLNEIQGDKPNGADLK